MGMDVGYYLLCLILMLPLAAVTAFAALIESITKFGFWTTFGVGFTSLLDPLGDGICAYAAMGLLPALAATAAVAAVAFVLWVAPRGIEWGLVWILSPSLAGLALSTYCALRSFGKVGA